MSYPWKPPVYGPEGRELQWLNCCMQSHDTFCGCNNPMMHLILGAAKRSNYFGLNTENINTLQRCLGYGDPKDTTGDKDTPEEPDPIAEDHFEDGDLEALFAEDDATAG
uniref:ORF2 n=1 Tax=Chimpanzee anellovirus TaxID=1743410 RepID=A0A0S2GME5_9VIRU|nr:ORF2 [Chimpanzee anellovirus]